MARLALILFLVGVPLATLGADDGGEAEPRKANRRGRLTYEQLLERFDEDGDGKISREEHTGNARLFERLDADGDGFVTKDEFQALARNRRDRRELKAPQGVKVVRDIEFAKVDGRSLHVDLYLPEPEEPPEEPERSAKPLPKPPLLVWVHGGGWTKGSRRNVNSAFLRLTSAGYAVASVEYRLEGLGSHPDQVHDVKGAVRWLRANADEYGYDAKKIGVGGASAGGHLVLLLGTSGDVKELEGEVGGNAAISSRVQAVLSLFGPTDLTEAVRRHGGEGGEVGTRLESASPLTHITKDDPPVLVLHGDQDRLVPLSHSRTLVSHYGKAGLPITLHVVEGASHGGPAFSDEKRFGMMKAFFDLHIRGMGEGAR